MPSEKNADLSKEERIRKEKNRLSRNYKELADNKKRIAQGLIERAAFMRVELEDLEADLLQNGWTEPFKQGDKQEPYDRARPQGQSYQQLNANYQKIIKQLNDMLPAAETKPKKDDAMAEFVNFISERE